MVLSCFDCEFVIKLLKIGSYVFSCDYSVIFLIVLDRHSKYGKGIEGNL